MSQKLDSLSDPAAEIPFFSPTFCVYPWMEFIVGPTTNSRLCCIAKGAIKTETGKFYSTEKFSIDEIWNSYGFREARKKMLSGQKIKACSHCYYQESLGRTSYRESFNREWLTSSSREEILRRVETSRTNGGRVDSPPLYLDIRPGNLCNLQCRMCNPGSSSKIYQEHEELLKEKKEEFSPLIETAYFNKDKKMFHSWHENPKIWKVIDSWMPGVKKLYFTGGEPTLIKRNWEILDYIKDKGFSQNIYLDFNINCTHVPDKLLDTFESFQGVCLSLSIDGYGKVQEYIRYPSRWKVVEKNIKKVLERKTDRVSVYFSPVVQVYNILHLTELLRWVDSLQEEFECRILHALIFCDAPSFLDIAILPQNVRDRALKQIQEYLDTYQGSNSFLIECLQSIQTILKTKFKNSKKNLRQFFQYTRILDEKRGESFQMVLPELYQLLNEEGSWKSEE